MAKNITIAKLDMDTQGLMDSMQKTAKQIEDLRDKQDKLAQKGKEGTAQFQANEAALKMLTTAQRAQTAALSAQITEDGKLVSVKKAVKDAVNEVNNSENDYMANNQKLLALKKQLNSNDDDYEKRLAAINGKLQENNTWLQENGSAHAKLITTMDDYKQQVADSFNEINIFNGGLSGLISRAQEAGGVGPLVKGAFEGISTGIMGMTKSALAFMATPLGAALTVITALLSPIIDYLTNTEEGINAVTSVTRPLQSVFQALSGVFQQVGKFLFEAFSNPKKTMVDLYEFVKQNLINRFTAFGTILEGIMDLDFKKISNGVLQAATGVEDVIGKTQNAAKATGQFFDEAFRRGQQIDSLQKQLDRSQGAYTKRMGEISLEMDKQKSISDDTNLSHKERERAAIKAIELAKEQNRLAIERMNTEINVAKLKMQENGIDSKENQQLQEMIAKRNEALAGYEASEKSLQGKLNGIREDGAQKELARRQKINSDALEKQKLELDLFIAQQGNKAKTMQEELAIAEQVAAKKKKYAEDEFKFSAKTANDKIKFQLATTNIDNELMAQRAKVAVANAEAELKKFIENNQSKLKDGQLLNEELVNSEKKRLDDILTAEKGFQLIRLQQGTINKQEYDNQIATLDQSNNEKKLELDTTFKEAQRTKEAIDLENKRAADTANYDYSLGVQLERLDQQKAQELEAADKTGADKDLIEKKYAKMKQDTEQAVMNNKLDLANSTFGSLAAIMGKESAAGKAMAVAQATIDTYKSAVAAYGAMSNIPVVGPALGAVAAAAAVAAGIANVKKITATKAPKAEKGALFNIGGNRHSAGGTMFTGADGTQFEAEKGELIGVMNRNAARHFMAFNNAFPAGGASAPNYFAGGGIVSREIAQQTLNTDELAMKIAQANSMLPPPVVAVQDIVTEGSSYVKVRDAANF